MLQSNLVRIVNGRPVLDVGACRHPITIQRPGIASPPAYDAAGVVSAFSPFTTAMAAIGALRGTDVLKSGQTVTQLFLELALWYQAGILPNMRVVTENGSTYEIQSLENVLEMNVVLVLNCLGLGANV